MLCFTLGELANWCRAELANVDTGAHVKCVSTDTRSMRSGCVFFALKGERHDGHDFVLEAFDRGAIAVVVRKDWLLRNPGTPALVVEDTLKALGDAAAGYRLLFGGPVVCITGSSGKTTTKEMTELAVSSLGPVAKSEANYNNEVGVPLSIFKIGREHKAAVLELAMRGRGQIRYLAKIARPDVGVIVSIGDAHLGLLGSRLAIAEAKAELLDELPEFGTAVLPRDSEWYSLLTQRCACRRLSFGFHPEADFRVAGYEAGESWSRFSICFRGDEAEVELAAPGEHLAVDAAAAVAAAVALGVPLRTAADALSGFQPLDMRGARLAANGFTVINDAYNANPDSVAAALKSLAYCGGRKVALLGDMLELGDASVELHRKVGALAAKIGIDLLVTVGNLGAEIGRGALDAGMPPGSVLQFTAPLDAAKALRELLRPGDVVLVKASRGARLEQAVEVLVAGNAEEQHCLR
ncbi:MAG: UDP-N-acetylmuramoyl-tripeptide--D-alanyl-D-alanine ligase [Armatimonadota bacterium]